MIPVPNARQSAERPDWRPEIRVATKAVLWSQCRAGNVDPATVRDDTISAVKEALSRTIIEAMRPMKPCWARDRDWTRRPKDADLVAVFHRAMAVESINWNDAISFDSVLTEVRQTLDSHFSAGRDFGATGQARQDR